MTRKYRNLKGSLQPKRILKYSEEWIQYRKLRGADSVKVEHCDIDDDGHLDSIVRAWRSPALKKIQICDYLPGLGPTNVVVSFAEPQTGPAQLVAESLTPTTGPDNVQVNPAGPLTGPTALNAAAVLNAPAAGPSSLNATSVFNILLIFPPNDRPTVTFSDGARLIGDSAGIFNYSFNTTPGTITLTAVPVAGMAFSHWSGIQTARIIGGGTLNSNPISFEVTEADANTQALPNLLQTIANYV
jgi:hypothetical protein